MTQAAKRLEEETEWNRGVYFKAVLQAVPADESIAVQKGIRKSGDKVCGAA